MIFCLLKDYKDSQNCVILLKETIFVQRCRVCHLSFDHPKRGIVCGAHENNNIYGDYLVSIERSWRGEQPYLGHFCGNPNSKLV